MNASTHILRVISLRSESSGDETFEIALRNAGHKVTVLTSTEPAFALLNSSWPDVVLFDPISQFGMSGSIQRMRTGFDGAIVATGLIPDPTISAMLQELGISKFAASVSELFTILKNVPTRAIYNDDDSVGVVANSAESVRPPFQTERQLQLTATDTLTLNINADPKSETPSAARSEITDSTVVPARSLPSLRLPSIGLSDIKLPLKRWHRTALGTAFIAAVVVAVVIPFFGSNSDGDTTENVAKALPVVPQLLLKPLAPLTIDELSGENLPLEIAGIQDQAVIEKAAVAFWGDTAPDAFVTVNGDPVEVSEYGALVIDFPLEDGANFIEVLASDFQGRTTRKSFTVVSLQ
ncbi:MAG: hypothetical protein O2921_04985 [Chloroflexi bacterium]|nr:hypothetical protein [Chloroflexota bacterium]MDA1281965.1 hypothetical protein [Chloroflexota bacterium]